MEDQTNPEDEEIFDDVLGEEDEVVGELEVDLDEVEEEEEYDKSNKAFAAMRVQNKELKKSLEELSARISEVSNQPAVQAAPEPQLDMDDPSRWSDEDWDEYARKDWKGAVDLRSEMKAKRYYDQVNEAKVESDVLLKSKQAVLARHPELNDNNSEKARVFTNILNDNPRYITDPKGPIHAMRDMEEYMETTLGYTPSEIVSAEKRGAAREAGRQNRIALSSTEGRHVSKDNKVTISRDELDFCKLQGLDPKEYAKTKVSMEKSKGTVQL